MLIDILLGTASIAAPQQQALPAPLIGLCDSVATKARAAPESGFRYEYERIVFAAAKLDAAVRSQSAALKPLRDYWRANLPLFRCRSTTFEILDGNVLKYAISSGSYHVLKNAASVWKLDLNVIPDDSGETILDYLLRRAGAFYDTPGYPELASIYVVLRNEGGAKFGCEVPGGKTFSTPPFAASDKPAPLWIEYLKACKSGKR